MGGVILYKERSIIMTNVFVFVCDKYTLSQYESQKEFSQDKVYSAIFKAYNKKPGSLPDFFITPF